MAGEVMIGVVCGLTAALFAIGLGAGPLLVLAVYACGGAAAILTALLPGLPLHRMLSLPPRA